MMLLYRNLVDVKALTCSFQKHPYIYKLLFMSCSMALLKWSLRYNKLGLLR